jgi:predicted DNA-binding WGR domain protein
MSNSPTSETVLHRIDPAQNMARFYCLSLQPTLFGEVSVVRAWGRIGTRGRIKVDSYPTGEGAATAFAHLEKAKRRRGYRDQGRAPASVSTRNASPSTTSGPSTPC